VEKFFTVFSTKAETLQKAENFIMLEPRLSSALTSAVEVSGVLDGERGKLIEKRNVTSTLYVFSPVTLTAMQ
jgi:hypothetical protein